MNSPLRLGVVIALLVGLGGCSGIQNAQAMKPDFHRGMHAFNLFCANCHLDPDSEAPQLDEPGDWDPRAMRWRAVLKQHVAHGFLSMPPRGGHPRLSEQNIDDALYFMEIKIRAME